MNAVSRSLLGLSGTLALAGCSDVGTNAPGRNLQIATLPLTLPGIDQACFDLRVANAADETVWSMGLPGTSFADGDTTTICSGQYGNGDGGDISYVGPCDADGPGGVQTNSVTLWVDGLYDANGDDISDDGTSNWQDPCGAAGCTLEFDCKENEDTSVVFNLTIMRDANQGFFDVAVNFEDIFCSAKFDCTDVNDDAIQLLFKPDGTRGDTIIAAVACTSGPGTNTVLHFDGDIKVTCGADTIALDPSIAAGNAYNAGNPDPDLTDAVWQYAVYNGTEQLDCEGESCAKKYWNVAIGIDPTQGDCHVEFFATASDATQMTTGWTAANASYPVIHFDVPVTGADGGLICSQHPLNGGDEVATEYTPFGEPQLFCYAFDGSAVAMSADAGCAPAPDLVRFIEGRNEAISKIASYEIRRDDVVQLEADILAATLAVVTFKDQQAVLQKDIDTLTLLYERNYANAAKAIDGLNANLSAVELLRADTVRQYEASAAQIQSFEAQIAALQGSPIIESDESTWVVNSVSYLSYEEALQAYDSYLALLQSQRTEAVAAYNSYALDIAAYDEQISAAAVAVATAQAELAILTETYDNARAAKVDQIAAIELSVTAETEIIAARTFVRDGHIEFATLERVAFTAINQVFINDLIAINATIVNATAMQLQADFIGLLAQGQAILDDTIEGPAGIIIARCQDFECVCIDPITGPTGSTGIACLNEADVIKFI